MGLATVDTFFRPVRVKRSSNTQLPVRTCAACKTVFFDENSRRFSCDRCLPKAKRAFQRAVGKGAKHARQIGGDYGLRSVDYGAMLRAQGGTCAICKNPPQGRRLSVDHCHTTGVIRGLLCAPCNLSLGSLRDDPARLRAAAAYLERSRA